MQYISDELRKKYPVASSVYLSVLIERNIEPSAEILETELQQLDALLRYHAPQMYVEIK